MKHILTTLAAVMLTGAVMAQSLDSLERAVKTAKGDQQVKALNELFRAYLNSDPVKAIGFTREALSLALDIGDEKGKAASYNNLGVAYRNQGAFDKALEYYLISMQTYEKLGNKEGVATTKSNIGNIYSLKHDQAQAMKYMEEARKLFTELNDQPHIVGVLNNLGNLHSELQLYEQALKFYSQSWQLSEKLGKPFSDPLNNIGNIYVKQSNYKEALVWLDKSMDLAQKENNRLAQLNLLVAQGNVYTRLGQTDRAQSLLTDAQKLSAELQAFVFEPTVLKNIAENYAKQGRMKEAYESMVKYDLARDKIYGEESSRKIAQMEMAMDIQAKEKEVEVLKKDDTIKTMELRHIQMVVTIVVLSIVALVAFGNIYLHNKKSKVK